MALCGVLRVLSIAPAALQAVPYDRSPDGQAVVFIFVVNDILSSSPMRADSIYFETCRKPTSTAAYFSSSHEPTQSCPPISERGKRLLGGVPSQPFTWKSPSALASFLSSLTHLGMWRWGYTRMLAHTFPYTHTHSLAHTHARTHGESVSSNEDLLHTTYTHSHTHICASYIILTDRLRNLEVDRLLKSATP